MPRIKEAQKNTAFFKIGCLKVESWLTHGSYKNRNNNVNTEY